MRKLNGALIVGTMCLAFAGTSLAADDTFDTAFTYNAQKSMAVNYENFVRTADAACAAEVGRVGRQSLSAQARLESNCRNELLTKVVKATRNEILIAYHKQKMASGLG